MRHGGNLVPLDLLNKHSLLISHCLKRLTWSFQFPLDFNPDLAFRSLLNVGQCHLGNYKSDNFS